MGHDSFDPLADVKVISEGMLYTSDADKKLYTITTAAAKPIKIKYEPFSVVDKKQEQINTLIKATSRLIEENQVLADELANALEEIARLHVNLDGLRGTIDLAVESITDLDSKIKANDVDIAILRNTKADKT